MVTGVTDHDEEADHSYYPCEGSDIDEDNDSDLEGETGQRG